MHPDETKKLKPNRWISMPDFVPAIPAILCDVNPYAQCKREKNKQTGEFIFRKISAMDWFKLFIAGVNPQFYVHGKEIHFIVGDKIFSSKEFYAACKKDCLRWRYEYIKFAWVYNEWLKQRLLQQEVKIRRVRMAIERRSVPGIVSRSGTSM